MPLVLALHCSLQERLAAGELFNDCDIYSMFGNGLALCVISAFVEFYMGGRSCGRSRKRRPGCLSCRKTRDLSSVQKAYRGIGIRGKKCGLNINLNMGWKKSLALEDLCNHRDSATAYFK
jgi:hypothetical protein